MAHLSSNQYGQRFFFCFFFLSQLFLQLLGTKWRECLKLGAGLYSIWHTANSPCRFPLWPRWRFYWIMHQMAKCKMSCQPTFFFFFFKPLLLIWTKCWLCLFTLSRQLHFQVCHTARSEFLKSSFFLEEKIESIFGECGAAIHVLLLME